MQDTLLSDIDASIVFWYACYILSNIILLATALVVIVLPFLTSTTPPVVAQKWGFITAACGALLAYLGLNGVSNNFIQARNDLQIAKYQYYTDKDRPKLIAAYEKAKALAIYIPNSPSGTDKSEHKSEPAAAQSPQKNP